MTTETAQLISWLTIHGYRDYPDRWHRSVWSASKRLPEGAPECKTNGPKISWHVRLYEIEAACDVHVSAEVELIAENEAGVWLKLMAYSLPYDVLYKRLDEIEADLLAAWVVVC